MTNKIKKFFIGLGLLVLLLSVGKFVQAQSVPILGMHFGGRILTVALCNEGIWIVVGPPRPGSFIITPTTLTFPFPFYRLFHPLAFVLGLAIPAPISCTQGMTVFGSGNPVLIIGSGL